MNLQGKTVGLKWLVVLIGLVSFAMTPVSGQDQNLSATGRHSDKPAIRIITLGDSITKGVRPGVTASQTFASLLNEKANQKGHHVEVINVGIGGERTDQALLRLDRDVISKKPQIVTVMYGANDSYVDIGKKQMRITEAAFRENLDRIVQKLRSTNIRVILMTEPRWGSKAKPNGLGESPNLKMEPFMQVIREKAKADSLPLVDHYQLWTEFEAGGGDIGKLTTDQLHPNPQGHQSMADSIWPVLEQEIQKVPSLNHDK